MPTIMTADQFETERFDLVKQDRAHIPDHGTRHDKRSDLDVWIESSDKGERFLSQIIVEGEHYAVRKQVYTKKCYILREKATGRYHFLDMNDCGFWLHGAGFCGAETFSGAESVKIQQWLADSLSV